MPKMLIVAGVAAFVSSVPGAAHENGREIVVSYADIDLASPRGVATFDRRLAQAVKDACPSGGVRELWRLREIAACRSAQTANVTRIRDAVLARAG